MAENECIYCGPACSVAYGTCHCGCGEVTTRFYNGKPRAYKQGHQQRVRYRNRPTVPEGYCGCGCGMRTELIRSTKTYRRLVTGHTIALSPLPDFAATKGECRFCGPACKYGIGVCHCGCNQKVQRAKNAYLYADGKRIARGDFLRYVSGHGNTLRKNAVAKLSTSLARVIRREYLTGMTAAALSRKYGVSKAAMSDLLRLKSYADAGIATEEEVREYQRQNAHVVSSSLHQPVPKAS